jgi:hypothetical protein
VATTTAVPDAAVVFRAGQLVEVRSAAEIMATLDENGELEALPFMPEMLQYCGRQFRVGKVASKLCDTMTRSGMRRMHDAVHLADLRCGGSAHGGCQANCLIYWKTAWLRPLAEAAAEPTLPSELTLPSEPVVPDSTTNIMLTLTDLSRRPADVDGAERYRCQVTELLRAAPDSLPMRDLAQYVDDVRSGNVGPVWTARAFAIGLFNRYQDRSRQKLPRWLLFRHGLPWGFLRGRPGKTPTGRTDLQPGELVRIKSKHEIEQTLNEELLNRGMGFDAEMARFCGRTARVSRRVTQILDEKTGRMIHMKSPCIVLEGIICEGAYNASCPRGIPAYWREIWLDRVDQATG